MGGLGNGGGRGKRRAGLEELVGKRGWMCGTEREGIEGGRTGRVRMRCERREANPCACSSRLRLPLHRAGRMVG